MGSTGKGMDKEAEEVELKEMIPLKDGREELKKGVRALSSYL